MQINWECSLDWIDKDDGTEEKKYRIQAIFVKS